LCFEHVDNLGAYSIPSETGLLIPSDLDSQGARSPNCFAGASMIRAAPRFRTKRQLWAYSGLALETPLCHTRHFLAAGDP